MMQRDKGRGILRKVGEKRDVVLSTGTTSNVARSRSREKRDVKLNHP